MVYNPYESRCIKYSGIPAIVHREHFRGRRRRVFSSLPNLITLLSRLCPPGEALVRL